MNVFTFNTLGFALKFLLLLFQHVLTVRANIEELYDTKSRTSDLLWTKYPERGGWEELTGLSLEQDSIRYHQVCNTEANPNPSNWIRSPYIESKGAKRAYIDVEFAMVKCEELDSGCSETFNLFYYESDSDQSSSTFPPWRENPYVKIDTIAAGERFSNIKFSRKQGINYKTWTLGPLKKRGFYIAAQDKGACMSLMRVRVYSNYCPNITNSLAYFSRTVAGNDVASLVEVEGKCVEYAKATSLTTPRYYCNSKGEWKVRTGVCHCKPGYQANSLLTTCEVCGLGKYKSFHGNEECAQCPAHSISAGVTATQSSSPGNMKAASHFCVCEPGYYRTPLEDIHFPCTKPPTEPTNVSFHVNESTLILSWGSPLNDGGRSDLYYNVTCDLCESVSTENNNPENCNPCQSTVVYNPRPHMMLGSELKVTDLKPFSNYRFQVFAMNGVTPSSETAPARALVLIVTEEAAPSEISNTRLVSTSSHNFTLSWSQPRLPNGIITKYQILCDDVTNGKFAASIKDDKARLTFETTNRSLTVDALIPGHLYSVRVRAATSVGYGPFGHPVTARTKEDPSAGDRTSSPVALIIGVGVGVCVVALVMSALAYYYHRQKSKIIERMSKESTSDEKIPFNNSRDDTLIVNIPTNGNRIYVEYPDPHKAVRDYSCEIDISSLTIEETIGQGEFGEVCRGSFHSGSDKVCVAVKRLKQGADAKDQLNFLKEASTMAQFSHPNVVQLKGVVTRSRPQMIVTEFMENGSLDVFLKKNTDALTVLQLIQMLKGIASGMRYLSCMKYVHRDLAARNILINSDLTCKVSDFGLSRTLENNPHATYTTQGGKIAIRWTAPECIRFRQFTSASDVWSYGIVMWEVMSYGEKPYWDMSNQEVIESIDEGYRLPAPYNCPICLHQLMVECWAFDAKNRPNMNNIYQRLEMLLESPANLTERSQEQPTTPTTDSAMSISIPA